MQLSTLQSKMNLLSINSDAKTKKSNEVFPDTLTSILYLAPATISGYEVCPSRSQGCTDSCLFTAGRGAMNSVQQARIRKTKMFFEEQESFFKHLKNDLTLLNQYCIDTGLQGYVRLNGTSDIRWEDYGLFEQYPLLNFYDYTKRTDHEFNNLPANYRLTFSRSETMQDVDLSKLIDVVNIAIVFDKVPETWSLDSKELQVHQGDLTDLRYKDPHGVIIGLVAKGMAKKDVSGFVINTGK